MSLFQAYPPRDLEITIYGATKETYEAVTRQPGSYAAFKRGLQRLIDGGIRVKLKAMALKTNVHEMAVMAEFSKELTNDTFRYDPQLHFRYDHDPVRNAEIKQERLSPREITLLEVSDPHRMEKLEETCQSWLFPEVHQNNENLFSCSAGTSSFSVRYDGMFRLCSSLNHPVSMVDLRQTALKDAWNKLVPRVRGMTSNMPEFMDNCGSCALVSLCMWCPAHAYIETGRLDGWSENFCRITHERAHQMQVRLNQSI